MRRAGVLAGKRWPCPAAARASQRWSQFLLVSSTGSAYTVLLVTPGPLPKRQAVPLRACSPLRAGSVERARTCSSTALGSGSQPADDLPRPLASGVTRCVLLPYVCHALKKVHVPAARFIIAHLCAPAAAPHWAATAPSSAGAPPQTARQAPLPPRAPGPQQRPRLCWARGRPRAPAAAEPCWSPACALAPPLP